MTAREMFEKLGFIKIKTSDSFLIYEKYYYETGCLHSLLFNKSKKVIMENVDNVRGETGIGIVLTMPLLNAINKQIEELGWQNEHTTKKRGFKAI